MEIKSSELRVGNILEDKYSGHKLVVSELTKDRITFDYQTQDKWQAVPIEINDEILLKCGFELVPPDNPGFHLWSDYVKDSLCITLPYFEFVFDDGSAEVKYMHQLQNLYFALTGKELTINL